jgi:2-oxo-4-hydroxy-4-carboxy-5-ureidoimidazoline decarboxylase
MHARYRVPVELDEFNTADAATAAELVGVWAAIPRWVDALVAGRPYPTVDDLAARAEVLAAEWTTVDLDAALAHHPRIGEKPRGSGAEAAASRREQASMSSATDEVAARLAAGNAAYEERFGRVFLIRAAGRTPAQMLAELDRRLDNDPAAEAAEAAAQLAEIAVLRLRSAIADNAAPDARVLR